MATADGRIKLDDGTQYFRSGFANNYLIVLWLKLVTPPPSSVGVLHLTKSSSAFDTMVLGLGRSGDSGSGGSAAFMGPTSTTKNGGVYTPGATPFQIAFASEGGQLKYYENGTLQAAVTGSTTLVDSTAPLCLGKTQVSGGYTGVLGTKYYRTWAENLTISGKTAQERLTQDYLANVSRFS